MSERKTAVKKKKRWGKTYEYVPVVRSMTIDEEKRADMEKELKNLKPTTPESFANKYGIKVSLARQILKKYAEEGKIKVLAKGSNTNLYSS